jgi:phi13 family phage major tail protein
MASDTKNKIEFGLSNVYYAPITGYDSETETYTYSTPKKYNGAVSLSLDAEGDDTTVYADNISYYIAKTNDGYSGSLGMRTIPDDFRIDVLGEKQDANGLIVEDSDAQGTEYALLFQFEGDARNQRHILYRCSSSRPSLTGKTKEKSTDAYEYTVPITSMPRENDHVVKAKLEYSAENKDTYNNWFKEVKEPSFSSDDTD